MTGLCAHIQLGIVSYRLTSLVLAFEKTYKVGESSSVRLLVGVLYLVVGTSPFSPPRSKDEVAIVNHQGFCSRRLITKCALGSPLGELTLTIIVIDNKALSRFY